MCFNQEVKMDKRLYLCTYNELATMRKQIPEFKNKITNEQK